MTNNMINLSEATVLTHSELSPRESKAITMLVEEVYKRTGIRLPVSQEKPAEGGGVILVTVKEKLSEVAGCGADAGKLEELSSQIEAEGYVVTSSGEGSAPVVYIVGNDERGFLFGAGHFLRKARLNKGSIAFPSDYSLSTSPEYVLRGHQLGYRPKTNSYDGWDIDQWEQYIRELAIFGANCIELIPPRSDDDADSPHFPKPPLEMMIGMSRIADEYGLDVWIWYPAMDDDYSDPDTVEFALKEWREIFEALPRIDAILVPGGDPGHAPPWDLMPMLEKQTASLREIHPNGQMWVSPQGFTAEWMRRFMDYIKDEPKWLTGVVFGPWIHMLIEDFREMVPACYPLRYYPDITHSRRCQYPVPEWDLAYAATNGREPINPRPVDEAKIFNLITPHTIGALTYSEGCNDDVNKALWSQMCWDSKLELDEILRDFSRFFICEEFTEAFAQGLFALERNWRGPLLTNAGVYTTLQQFQEMEEKATPQVLQNWRFQQALFRAYFDAHVRRRLLHETALEENAMDCLREAHEMGSLVSMDRAEEFLDRAVTHRVGNPWRMRVYSLAEALFQSIQMQLSVKRYQAIAMERGGNLDSFEYPLNDRLWLKDRFERIRKLESENERLAEIDRLVDWTNPGGGGFYDDLGDARNQPHVVEGLGYDKDPAMIKTAMISYLRMDSVVPYRKSWLRNTWGLNDHALIMRYTDLDKAGKYKIRVVYSDIEYKFKIRLVANEDTEIHPLIEKPNPIEPIEFSIPQEETASGTLELRWYKESGLGGNGRGNSVAEIWLIKE